MESTWKCWMLSALLADILQVTGGFCSPMVSVAVTMLVYTELFFVETRVKVDVKYYPEVLLKKQMLPVKPRISGNVCCSTPVHLCTALVKQSTSFSRKHRIYLSSLHICGWQMVLPKPGWLPNLGTDARTCVQDTAPRHQQLEAASHWHRGQAYHKMLSTKLLVNGESGYFHAWRQKNITLNICWNKSGTFQSHHPKTGSFKSHSATNSLPRKTRYVSRHFRRSYLKANKVSKSEGTKKVEYAYNFWKCADAVYSKLSKLVRLVETTACQSWCFFETQRVISLFGLVFSSAFRSVLNSNWDQRSAKKWSRFLVWSQRLTERLAETKLRTDRSLNPKLINSPVDFACTRYRLIS